MPGPAEHFGTVRVEETIDGVAMSDVGLMVTGEGGHALTQRGNA